MTTGSDPKGASESTQSVKTPDEGAPTAPEGTEETEDSPKLASERAEPTKVKAKAEDDKSIADQAIADAKERIEDFRGELQGHLENVAETYGKQSDMDDIAHKERELAPADQAVRDVLEEAQRKAAESIKAYQATVAATALAKLGIETTLDSSNPGERVALSNQRQEIVDKIARAISELNRYDETAPAQPNLEDANLDNLAAVGPDQNNTYDDNPTPEPQPRPKRPNSPQEIVDKIIERVIELMETNEHDYYTARKILQTVGKRLGQKWVQHRDARKVKAKEEPFDPNHHVNPIDGSGSRFNVYADSAGSVGDKQISTPEYMVPHQSPVGGSKK